MGMRRWAVAAAILLAGSCAASPDDASSLPDGVVFAVFRDRSGESASARFHDVPVLLVSEDGTAYMDPPAEFAAAGELLPDVWVQPISAEGVDRLRALDGVPEDFVPQDLPALVGSENVGTLDFLLPDAYLFTATPVARSDGAPVLEWPATASVSLAEADPCQRLPEREVGEAFETAADGSLFDDDGVLYRIAVKQAWPGATC